MRSRLLLFLFLLLAACSNSQEAEPMESPTQVVADITETPAVVATATSTPSNTPTLTSTPSVTPTETSTPVPTDTPTATSEPTSTPAPTLPPCEASLLDFRPVAGQWEGEPEEDRGIAFWVQATLSPCAAPGAEVGLANYGFIGDDRIWCQGDWTAVSALESEFTVNEEIRGPIEDCPDGTVHLIYNPQTDTMSYDLTPSEGSDQGRAYGILHRSE